MALIDNDISIKVLFIGIDYKHSKGGVPEVERYYSHLFSPFKFIATSIDGGKVKKAMACSIGMCRFLALMIFDRSIKIVHVNGCSDNSFWRKRMFILLSKAFNKKVVYHMHSGGFLSFSNAYRKAVKSTLDLCDCIIALTPKWKQFFHDEFDKDNVCVIHNGVYPPKKASTSQHVVKTLNLLFLGKINESKGVFDLLEVLAKNKAQYQEKLKFLFGGVGEVQKAQDFIHKHGIEDIACYIGWIDEQRKPAILNACDVFILPSYFEGEPVCILEAMSYGKPVIATNVGGIPDLIEHNVNGLLIEPGNLNQIEHAIDTALADRKALKAMGQASLSKISSHMPQAIASRLSSLYKSLL